MIDLDTVDPSPEQLSGSGGQLCDVIAVDRPRTAVRRADSAAPAAAQQLLRSCGVSADRVRVAVVQPRADVVIEEAQHFADQVPEALVGTARSAVLIILPADLPDTVSRLAAAAPSWPVGLGGAVKPHQCPISVGQAQRGAQISQQRGDGVVDVMARASARLLLEGVPPDMLRSSADATLCSLETVDGGDTLVRTLRTWLGACGVADATASALGVHRHTLRDRLERVERLTVGGEVAHDRGELWLAFEARDLAAGVEA